jgi:hypothetical protein
VKKRDRARHGRRTGQTGRTNVLTAGKTKPSMVPTRLTTHALLGAGRWRSSTSTRRPRLRRTTMGRQPGTPCQRHLAAPAANPGLAACNPSWQRAQWWLAIRPAWEGAIGPVWKHRGGRRHRGADQRKRRRVKLVGDQHRRIRSECLSRHLLRLLLLRSCRHGVRGRSETILCASQGSAAPRALGVQRRRLVCR